MVEQEKKMEEQETEHIIEEFEGKTETEIEPRKKIQLQLSRVGQED